MTPPLPKAQQAVLAVFAAQADAAQWLSAPEVARQMRASRPTVNRALTALVTAGTLVLIGNSVSTRYRLATASAPATRVPSTLPWSADSRKLARHLRQPVSHRPPSRYAFDVTAAYQPNQSTLLPAVTAQALCDQARALAPLLAPVRPALDVACGWACARLAGSHLSQDEAQTLHTLAAQGGPPPLDAASLMVLNHREALLFVTDSIPYYGISAPLLLDTHRLLMEGLVHDEATLGAVRSAAAVLPGSTYMPPASSQILNQVLPLIARKAAKIGNPVETACFLWTQLLYLHPFAAGNGRLARLAASMPLVAAGLPAVAFLEADPADHRLAALALQEQRDPAAAIDLFVWVYGKTLAHCQALVAAMQAPDATRVRWRTEIRASVRRVVADGLDIDTALAVALDAAPPEAMPPMARLQDIVRDALAHLDGYNASRYQLTSSQVMAWKARQP